MRYLVPLVFLACCVVWIQNGCEFYAVLNPMNPPLARAAVCASMVSFITCLDATLKTFLWARS